MATRVTIVGGTGKLGRIVADVVGELDDFELLAVADSSTGLDPIRGADLVVDVSTPGVSGAAVEATIAAGAQLLVGTSGWSAERIAQITPAVNAAGIGAVFIPNFSLGSTVASALVAAAAPLFGSIEIVEAHRDTKVDSPSGTAIRTAEMIAAARADVGPVESPHVDQRARGQQVASVPIHSMRRPGVIARQEVVLSAPGESIVIVHDTSDPAAAYAPGIRLALVGARDARGVVVGLENFVDIGIRSRGKPARVTPAEGGVPGQVAQVTST